MKIIEVPNCSMCPYMHTDKKADPTRLYMLTDYLICMHPSVMGATVNFTQNDGSIVWWFQYPDWCPLKDVDEQDIKQDMEMEKLCGT